MWKVPVVDLGKMFFIKIWRVVKNWSEIWQGEEILFQNLTRCKIFKSKSDAL